MASSSSPINSIVNLFHFHKVDRNVYDQLLGHGTEPSVARNVVALLIWLDTIGLDVLSYLNDHASNSYAFLRLVAEADAVLDCLRRDAPPRDSALAIPVLASLSDQPIDLGFFYFNRHVATKRIAGVLSGAGRVFFDDALYASFLRYEEAAADAWKRNAAPPPLPEELARTYELGATAATSSEDQRSLFLTFSKGFPLTKEEIEAYFREKWGDCVEKVAVQKPAAGSVVGPLYGRVVFTRDGYAGLVLNDTKVYKFAINGKQVWARQRRWNRRTRCARSILRTIALAGEDEAGGEELAGRGILETNLTAVAAGDGPEAPDQKQRVFERLLLLRLRRRRRRFNPFTTSFLF
ncbi:uncharacterized protein LOC141827182 [Curcuma longa]|uniref:uncharacterized protein LOC141827182 n=1 Tax=Curcuma longa TaxID=136217 RepID=UPI003D9F29E6